ncbi:DNase I-like protein [Auricularia subglabra TFB-10046 SS5]|nr:DNase I-like protein [Auricularia subglabra TFB-10046 SS5]
MAEHCPYRLPGTAATKLRRFKGADIPRPGSGHPRKLFRQLSPGHDDDEGTTVAAEGPRMAASQPGQAASPAPIAAANATGGPHPAPAPTGLRNPGKKKTRAGLRVATENIRGRGAARIAGSTKWKALADDIRRHRIGIIALQETHMTAEHVEEVHSYYPHLRVINSSLPDNPTGAGGVALVFNKLMTNAQDITSHTLIEGRAIVAKIKWHRDDDLTVLAVYAPTRRRENHEMWERIHDALLSEDYDLPMPDVLLGDFNFVEDAIDRFPARISPMDAPDSFAQLKTLLQMSDGWRETFPTSTEWTWRSSDRAAMSRIDRVYLTRRVLVTSRDWRTELSGLTANNHSRLSVEIVNPDMPALGPGRWTMQPTLIADEKFMQLATTRGIRAQQEIAEISTGGLRSAARSPQTVWAQMKVDIAQAARKRSKEIAGVRAAAMRKHEGERDALKASLRSAEDEDDRAALTAQLQTVETSIHKLKKKAHENIFAHRDAKNWAEAETMSKSWFSWTKSRKPRDTMTALRKHGSEPPENKILPSLARRPTLLLRRHWITFDDV